MHTCGTSSRKPLAGRLKISDLSEAGALHHLAKGRSVLLLFLAIRLINMVTKTNFPFMYCKPGECCLLCDLHVMLPIASGNSRIHFL